MRFFKNKQNTNSTTTTKTGNLSPSPVSSTGLNGSNIQSAANDIILARNSTIVPDVYKLNLDELGNKTSKAVGNAIGTGGGTLGESDVGNIVAKFTELAGSDVKDVIDEAVDIGDIIKSGVITVGDVINKIKTQLSSHPNIYDTSNDDQTDGVDDETDDQIGDNNNDDSVTRSAGTNQTSNNNIVHITHNTDYNQHELNDLVLRAIKGPALFSDRNVTSVKMVEPNVYNVKSSPLDSQALLGGGKVSVSYEAKLKQEFIAFLKTLGLEWDDNLWKQFYELKTNNLEESIIPQTVYDLKCNEREIGYLTRANFSLPKTVPQESILRSAIILSEKGHLTPESQIFASIYFPLVDRYPVNYFTDYCYYTLGLVNSLKYEGLASMVLKYINANLDELCLIWGFEIIGTSCYFKLDVVPKVKEILVAGLESISIRAKSIKKVLKICRNTFATRWALPTILLAEKFIMSLDTGSCDIKDPTVLNFPEEVFMKFKIFNSNSAFSFKIDGQIIKLNHFHEDKNGEPRDYEFMIKGRGGMQESKGKEDIVSEQVIDLTDDPVVDAFDVETDYTKIYDVTQFTLCEDTYSLERMRSINMKTIIVANATGAGLLNDVKGIQLHCNKYNTNWSHDNTTTALVPREINYPLERSTDNKENPIVSDYTNQSPNSYTVTRNAIQSINKLVEGPFISWMGLSATIRSVEKLKTTITDWYWLKSMVYTNYYHIFAHEGNQVINNYHNVQLNTIKFHLQPEANPRANELGSRNFWWTTAQEFFDETDLHYHKYQAAMEAKRAIFINAKDIQFNAANNYPPANNAVVIPDRVFTQIWLQLDYVKAFPDLENQPGGELATINGFENMDQQLEYIIVLFGMKKPVAAADYDALTIQLDGVDGGGACMAVRYATQDVNALAIIGACPRFDRRDIGYYKKIYEHSLPLCHEMFPDVQARERCFRTAAALCIAQTPVDLRSIREGTDINWNAYWIAYNRSDTICTDMLSMPGNLIKELAISAPSPFYCAAVMSGYLVMKKLETQLRNNMLYYHFMLHIDARWLKAKRLISATGMGLWLGLARWPLNDTMKSYFVPILSQLCNELAGHQITLGQYARTSNLTLAGIVGNTAFGRLYCDTYWYGKEIVFDAWSEDVVEGDTYVMDTNFKVEKSDMDKIVYTNDGDVYLPYSKTTNVMKYGITATQHSWPWNGGANHGGEHIPGLTVAKVELDSKNVRLVNLGARLELMRLVTRDSNYLDQVIVDWALGGAPYNTLTFAPVEQKLATGWFEYDWAEHDVMTYTEPNERYFKVFLNAWEPDSISQVNVIDKPTGILPSVTYVIPTIQRGMYGGARKTANKMFSSHTKNK